MKKRHALAAVLSLGISGACVLAGWPDFMPFTPDGASIVSTNPAAYLMAAWLERACVAYGSNALTEQGIAQVCTVNAGYGTTDVHQVFRVVTTNGTTNLMWYGNAEWSSNAVPSAYAQTLYGTGAVASCSEILTARTFTVEMLTDTILTTNLVGWAFVSNAVTYTTHPRGLYKPVESVESIPVTNPSATRAYQPLTFVGAASLDGAIIAVATNFLDTGQTTGDTYDAWFSTPLSFTTNYTWTGSNWLAVYPLVTTNFPTAGPWLTASSLLYRATAGTTDVQSVYVYDSDWTLPAWPFGLMNQQYITNSVVTQLTWQTRWTVAPQATNYWILGHTRIAPRYAGQTSPDYALACDTVWHTNWLTPRVEWVCGDTSTPFAAFSVKLEGFAFIGTAGRNSPALTSETVSVASAGGADATLMWQSLSGLYALSGVTTNSTNEYVRVVYKTPRPLFYPAGAWMAGKEYYNARYRALNAMRDSAWTLWTTNYCVQASAATNYWPKVYPTPLASGTNASAVWSARKSGSGTYAIETYTYDPPLPPPDPNPMVYRTTNATWTTEASASSVKTFVLPKIPLLSNATASVASYVRFTDNDSLSGSNRLIWVSSYVWEIPPGEIEGEEWVPRYTTNWYFRAPVVSLNGGYSTRFYKKDVATSVGAHPTTNTVDFAAMPAATDFLTCYGWISGTSYGYSATTHREWDMSLFGYFEELDDESVSEDYADQFDWLLQAPLGIATWTFDYRAP